MAHKAVLRGKFISVASLRSKQNRHNILQLSRELDLLNKNPTALLLENTRRAIEQKRLELDSLLTAKVEKALRWSRARFLLYSNAASTMFARKLNQSLRPLY